MTTENTPRVTQGVIDSAHYGPIGDAARNIASYCDGNARAHVYTAAFNTLTRAEAAASAREAELVEALGNVLEYIDNRWGYRGEPIDQARATLARHKAGTKGWVMGKPFVPFRDQRFDSHAEWVSKAQYWLTCHPEYNNTEHGDQKGWRGTHFTALCFDQKGRRCLNGGDMRRADEEGAFPVWWIWPDQIAGLLMERPND